MVENFGILLSRNIWCKKPLTDWLLCIANQLGKNCWLIKLIGHELSNLPKLSTAKVLCYIVTTYVVLCITGIAIYVLYTG